MQFLFAISAVLTILIGITNGTNPVLAEPKGDIRPDSTALIPNKKYDACLRENSKNDKLTQAIFKKCKRHLSPMKKGTGLTAGEVIAVIRFHLVDIRRCYEDAIKKTPDLSGKLHTNFVISNLGTVKSAVPSTKPEDLQDSKLKECVGEVISSWEFPRPRGKEDVTVNYPFVFNPL